MNLYNKMFNASSIFRKFVFFLILPVILPLIAYDCFKSAIREFGIEFGSEWNHSTARLLKIYQHAVLRINTED